jgi:hypothetical protein
MRERRPVVQAGDVFLALVMEGFQMLSTPALLPHAPV